MPRVVEVTYIRVSLTGHPPFFAFIITFFYHLMVKRMWRKKDD